MLVVPSFKSILDWFSFLEQASFPNMDGKKEILITQYVLVNTSPYQYGPAWIIVGVTMQFRSKAKTNYFPQTGLNFNCKYFYTIIRSVMYGGPEGPLQATNFYRYLSHDNSTTCRSINPPLWLVGYKSCTKMAVVIYFFCCILCFTSLWALMSPYVCVSTDLRLELPDWRLLQSWNGLIRIYTSTQSII